MIRASIRCQLWNRCHHLDFDARCLPKLEDADLGGQVQKWILASQAKFGGEQAKANELEIAWPSLGQSMRRWITGRSLAFWTWSSSEALSCISNLLKNRRIPRNAKRFLTAAWSR